MKIRLIEPEPPGMHVAARYCCRAWACPPSAPRSSQHGHDVLIYIPQMAPIDWDDVYTADLVGISTTTSTATTGLPVRRPAARARHPRGHRRLTRHLHGRRGAASTSTTWPAARAASSSCSSSSRRCRASASSTTIRGLSFVRDGEAVHNPLRERCADLDSLPFPDLTLIQGHEKLRTTPIMTSWGCPFACNFCSVTAMFGTQVPLPQPRERHRRDQREAARKHLLLRRQHGRRQESASRCCCA